MVREIRLVNGNAHMTEKFANATSQNSNMKDRPWLFRTYSGHSSAAASNELYRKNLARGQTGLSVAFDLPTQTGYDSDHPLAISHLQSNRGRRNLRESSHPNTLRAIEEPDSQCMSASSRGYRSIPRALRALRAPLQGPPRTSALYY